MYKIATIHVSGVEAQVLELQKITMGISGATVVFCYDDPMWDGLIKNVVFEGTETVAVADAGDVVAFPAEVAGMKNTFVRVGVCGVDTEKNVIIPTLWAELGAVRDSSSGSFPPPAEKELPFWAQIQADVEALKNGSSGGGLTVTDDGEGNVVITASGSVQITDDGNGNVVIS